MITAKCETACMQCVRLLLEGLDYSPVLFSSPAALYTAMELCGWEVDLGGVPINKVEKKIGILSPFLSEKIKLKCADSLLTYTHYHKQTTQDKETVFSKILSDAADFTK